VTAITDLGSAPLRNDGAMPLLGFGTWRLSGPAAQRATADALQAGYRHVDTATMYGNEAEVGEALRESGVPRTEVFLTTKLPAERVGMERSTLTASLAALGVDHVDLWLIHWPPGGAGLSTWREFVKAQEEGLVRDIGVSNYSLDQIDELVEATGVTPAVNQVKWGPHLHDAKVFAGHIERGVVLEGYSPFRSGPMDDPVLVAVAEEVGATVPQVIVRWHVQHGIVVIPKSARPERIVSNADVGGFTLSDEQVARIDSLGD
jgi:diketogulonate reductase-like aldo/keto reductase